MLISVVKVCKLSFRFVPTKAIIKVEVSVFYHVLTCFVQVGTEDGCVVLFSAASDDLQYLRAFHKLEGELY